MVAAIDILIRTYFWDFRRLELSPLSVVKFEGYRRIVIVMPGSSLERLGGNEFPASAQAIVLRCQDYADDYLGQQVSKLNADRFTNAPLIAHIDSDSIFRAPCSLPAVLTKDGRPIIRTYGAPGGQQATAGAAVSPISKVSSCRSMYWCRRH